MEPEEPGDDGKDDDWTIDDPWAGMDPKKDCETNIGIWDEGLMVCVNTVDYSDGFDCTIMGTWYCDDVGGFY